MRINEIDIPEPGKKLSLPSEMDDLMFKIKQLDADSESARMALFKAVHNKDHSLYGANPKSVVDNIAQLKQQVDYIDNQKSQLEKEFDKKRQDIITSNTTQNLFQFIETHCASSLQSIQQSGKYLFRGTKSQTSSAFIGNSLKERQAKDSHPMWAEQFDYMLELNHIKALRKNSIFCTSSQKHAATFGDLYLIFPIDGHHHFSYTNRKDLVINQYHAESWTDKAAVEKLRGQLVALENNPQVPELIKLAALSYATYPWARLFASIPKMSFTHMKDVTQYVPEINLDWKAYVNLDSFNHEYAPSQTDLAKAISGGMEVLINGAYVALHYRTYAPAVIEHWKIPIK